MKQRLITIAFARLPYSELLPNNLRRTHWAVRSSVSATARKEAYYLGKEIPYKAPIEHCEIEEVFTVPTRKTRDIESLLGAAKPWIDGLVDAGIIVDDSCWHVHRLSGSVKHKKGVEKTEIRIKELAPPGLGIGGD